MQPESPTLLSHHEESRLFWRLRRQTVRNIWRQTLSQSRLRLSIVAILSGVFWITLFLLFVDGFHYLANAIPSAETHEQVVSGVFGLFFASLLAMLVFSTGIILYSSLYRSRETAFLLTTPARTEQIFIHKLQEAVLFSSWGFVLMGTPMLVAYGMSALAPWHYFALLLPFMAAFVYVPSALGATLCMWIVYKAPTARLHILIAACVAAAAACIWLGWSIVAGGESDLLTPNWFHELLSRLKFSQHRLLPSWWLSSGLLEAARRPTTTSAPNPAHPPWAESVMFLALLVSNGLMLRQLAIWTAARTLRGGYSRVHATAPARRRAAPAWIDRAAMAGCFFLSRPMRLLIVKDLRTFRRDPVQWSQFFIFFGLLGMYFLNVRRFGYNDENYAAWVNMISFLNLAVVGLILSTFTTRFIFPMISLEGRRFWILGLLPVRRETILWGKFAFATVGSLATCLTLVLLSDLMLRVPPLIALVHVLSCTVLCVGLAGIAVGLGARLPNLREESPSKIAAGFGGTLNLVISTFYIIAVVALTAVPCHFYVAGINRVASLGTIGWGAAASVLLGVAATVIPLRIGFRAFREMEF